jgi:hypothetical protein
MKMYGIEIKQVDPTWKMRLYSWIDLKTLKPQFSVEVRDPNLKKWAHIYVEGEKFLKLFKSQSAAERFIKKIQESAIRALSTGDTNNG